MVNFKDPSASDDSSSRHRSLQLQMSRYAIQKLKQLGKRKYGDNGGTGNILEVFSFDKVSWKVPIPPDGSILVKDMVENVCRQLEIAQRCVVLFGISLEKDGKNYLKKSRILTVDWNRKMFLRIQFKVYTYDMIKDSDVNTFSYYLKQCRHDLRGGLFKPFLDRKEERAKYEMLLRMLLLEMAIISCETNMSLKQVFDKRAYFNVDEIMKKYLRSKQDMASCRRTLESSLSQFENIKSPGLQLVREVELLPGYECEEIAVRRVFKAKSGFVYEDIDIIIHPHKGISKKTSGIAGSTTVTLAAYEELFEVKIQDTTLQDKSNSVVVIITKRGALPEPVCVNNEEEAETLFAWIDGYYQLSYNLYASLDPASSRIFTRKLIHSSLPRKIAHAILLQQGKKDGNFLIKQHPKFYDSYVLYVICEDSIHNLEIFVNANGDYYFAKREKLFKSMRALIEHYTGVPLLLEDGMETVLSRCCDPESCGPVPFYSERLMSGAVVPKTNRPPVKINRNLISIDQSELNVLERLPKGQFGAVSICQGYDEFVPGLKVIRQLPQVEFNSSVFKQICECLESLKHGLIVSLIGVTFFSTTQLMLFEYFKMGSLDEYLITNKKEITISTLFVFASDIAQALMYLHTTMGLVHGNVRARNVFVTVHGGIKLSDACLTWVLQKADCLPLEAIMKRYNWRAPEVLLGGSLTEKADIWSYGVTIWEMMALKIPFDVNSSYLVEQMKDARFKASNFLQLESVHACPPDLFMILESCWMNLAEDRPTAQDLLTALTVLKRRIPTAVLLEKFYVQQDVYPDEVLPANFHFIMESGSEPFDSYGKVDGKRTSSEVSLDTPGSGRSISNSTYATATVKRTKTSITEEERELAGFLAGLSCTGKPVQQHSVVSSARQWSDNNESHDIQMSSPYSTITAIEKEESSITELPRSSDGREYITSFAARDMYRIGTSTTYNIPHLGAEDGKPEHGDFSSSLSDIMFRKLFKVSKERYARNIADNLKKKDAAEKRAVRNSLNKPNPFNIMVQVPKGEFIINPDVGSVSTSKGLSNAPLYDVNILMKKLGLLVSHSDAGVIGKQHHAPQEMDHSSPYVSEIPHFRPAVVGTVTHLSPASSQKSITLAQGAAISPYVWGPAEVNCQGVAPGAESQGEFASNGQKRDMSEFVSKLTSDVKLWSSRPEDLKLVTILGQGNFGKVYQAIWTLVIDGAPQKLHVAAKIIRNDVSSFSQSLKDIKAEVQNMALLQNDYVIKLLGTCHDDKEFFALITELMPLGSLDRYMATEKQYIDLRSVMLYCWQIAKGMEYLHSRNILHRDLAARNILVKTRDIVKVSDFGLSRVVDERDYYKASPSTPLPLKWYAVESIMYRRFTKPSDVWSYGITLWEMYSTWQAEKHGIIKPYGDMTAPQVATFLEAGSRLSKPGYCPTGKWNLILQCWDATPDNRPSFYLIYIEIEKLIAELKL